MMIMTVMMKKKKPVSKQNQHREKCILGKMQTSMNKAGIMQFSWSLYSADLANDKSKRLTTKSIQRTSKSFKLIA